MNWLSHGTDENSRFISIKEGQEAIFTIREAQVIENEPKYDPKSKSGDPQGWHIRLTDTEGRILDVGSYALQTALREEGKKDYQNKNGALVGRKVKIQHVGRGEWKVKAHLPDLSVPSQGSTNKPSVTPVQQAVEAFNEDADINF